MIIVKMISGLGNQLFQYAIARQISILTGIQIKLDLSFFEGQELRKYKLQHFNIKAGIANELEVDNLLKNYRNNSAFNRIVRKVEKLLPKYKRRLYKEETWWVYEPEIFKISSNTYIEGYWQHYKYFENPDPLLLQDLTLKSPISENATSLMYEMESQESVSVHIRRGDYLTDSNAYNLMGVLPIEYYSNAIKQIIKLKKEAKFYFFSDDLDWVKDQLRIDNPSIYVAGEEDYVDLHLMSKCKHNIIANSSFSWWGAYLNQNPNKIVIAPSNWVVPEEINKRIELQLPSWIKM